MGVGFGHVYSVHGPNGGRGPQAAAPRGRAASEGPGVCRHRAVAQNQQDSGMASGERGRQEGRGNGAMPALGSLGERRANVGAVWWEALELPEILESYQRIF